MSSRSLSGHLIGGGKYELLSQVGAGAMGTVWLGRHVELDRVVAVKMLGIVTSASSDARQRFLGEARAVSLLRHANSVRILDYAAEADDCWIVMEFLEGRNLSDVLEEQRTLQTRRAISIAVQVLAAVAEAHEFGIVHRDLKPANIMLLPWVDDDGREVEHVKVLDFGIATLAAQGNESGEVAGTPEYMSPEQAQGLPVDPRSDVYSVAVLLHQMVTGELPFQGDSALDTMLAHVTRPPRPPRSLNPALSEGIEEVLLRGLAKSPDERFSSARSMRAALLALPEAAGLRSDSQPKLRAVTLPRMPRLIAAGATPVPQPVPPHGPRKRLWVGLALLVLAGTAIAAAAVLSRPEPVPPGPELARALAPPLGLPPSPRPTLEPEGAAPAPDTAEAPETAPEPDTAAVPDAAASGLDPRHAPGDAGPEAQAEPTMLAHAARPEPVLDPRAPDGRADGERGPPPKRTPRPLELAVVAGPDAPEPPSAHDATRSPASVMAPAIPKDDPAKTPALPTAPAVTPTPHHPAPTPKPRLALAASVAVRDLVVAGSLTRSAVQRALDATRPALEQCYRGAAQAAQRDQAGVLSASMVIDVDGQATQVQIAAFDLPSFAGCARQALGRARSRERPDTGTALATFSLAITPIPAEAP